MRAYQAVYPVSTMARVLGVSTSGYYDWCNRKPSSRALEDCRLMELIVKYHNRSNGTYGALRIHQDIVQETGIKVGKNRIARLMRAAGITGVTRRRSIKTTTRSELSRPAPDLVDREFSADGPDKLWVADITFVPTLVGFFYLAVVIDVWSRRVVGWSMANNMRTEIVLGAMEMAICRRKPSNVIHHSDQGCQYTSVQFGNRCSAARVIPSMGSVGDCYDNAMAESFFATLECELLQRNQFNTKEEGKRAVFEYIEGWYNSKRRHSKIDYLSPMEYEKRNVMKLIAS